MSGNGEGDAMTDADARPTMIADERLAGRLARAYLRTLRPWVIFASVITLAAAGLGVLLASAADPDPIAVGLTVAGLTLVVVCWVLFAVTAAMAHRATRAAYPAGQPYAIRLTPDGIESNSAMGRTELTYSAISRVTVTGDAVLLRLRNVAGGAAILPREALTDEEVARLEVHTRTR